MTAPAAALPPSAPSAARTSGRSRVVVGAAFAAAVTLLHAGILVAVNQVTQPPNAATTERISVPIQAPTRPAPREQTPPPPRDELRAPALLPTPALAAAPMPSPQLAPTLPKLSLSLPGLGGIAVRSGGADATAALVGDMASAAPEQPAGPTRRATPLRRPAPRYPSRAAARGLEGEVIVRLRVEADGRVSNAVVVRATPAGVFEDAALAAARRYRFQPALKNGEPLPSTLEQRILFRAPRHR